MLATGADYTAVELHHRLRRTAARPASRPDRRTRCSPSPSGCKRATRSTRRSTRHPHATTSRPSPTAAPAAVRRPPGKLDERRRGEDGIRTAHAGDGAVDQHARSSPMAHEARPVRHPKTAEAFGVHRADGDAARRRTRPRSSAPTTVAPLTMATAYAGIANGGMVCTPIAIDKIVDADGKRGARRRRATCTQAVDPKVAAAMAYALQRVIDGSGTASGSAPDDGIDMLGKTGTTDEQRAAWLVGAHDQGRRPPSGSATSTARRPPPVYLDAAATQAVERPPRRSCRTSWPRRSASTAATTSRDARRTAPARRPGRRSRTWPASPSPRRRRSLNGLGLRLRRRRPAGLARSRPAPVAAHRTRPQAPASQGRDRDGLHQQRRPRRRCPNVVGQKALRRRRRRSTASGCHRSAGGWDRPATAIVQVDWHPPPAQPRSGRRRSR